MSKTESVLILASSILIAFLISGCGAGFFSAATTAHYQILPDGTKDLSYTSNREFDGLDVDLKEDEGKIKTLKIKVAKAGTAESAIAAALQLQMTLNETLQKLLPLIEKLAATGAMAGS